MRQSARSPLFIAIAAGLLLGVAALPAPASAQLADISASAVGADTPAAGDDAQGGQSGGQQVATARAFVDRLASQAISFLSSKSMSDDQKRDSFRKLLISDYDMGTIGRFALGPYWNQLNPAQRTAYQNDFREMIVRVYSQRFESYNGQSFKTTGAKADPQTPGDTVVNSAIVPADGQSAQVQVDWRVRNKNGQDKIVDIVVEGVSMALTQRSDFSSAIQQNGGNIDAFLQQLNGEASGAIAAPSAKVGQQ